MFEFIHVDDTQKHFFRYLDDLESRLVSGMEHMFADLHTDIEEQEGAYLLKIELPGFQKENIHINLEGDYLTVHAERYNEQSGKEQKACRSQIFSRSFFLSDVQNDAISACYHDGILRLKLPKRTKSANAVRSIEIHEI